jgi:hypothetical protein
MCVARHVQYGTLGARCCYCPLDGLKFQLALELHLVGVEKLGHKEPSDLRHE